MALRLCLRGKHKAPCIAFTVGAVVFVFGCIFAFVWPPVFKSVLQSQLNLRKGGQVYDFWTESPIPILLEAYFFNVTNPEEAKNGAKPVVEEIGPYVYEEKRKKVNVKWNDDEDSVDFEMRREWFFLPEKSVGEEDDMITSLNVVAATALHVAKDLGVFYELMVNNLFLVEQIHAFQNKTVKELMFDGYEDPIINAAETIAVIFDIFKIPFDKFGWFYPRNGSDSYDGLFTMGLGQKDLSTFGRMLRWNGTDQTQYYVSDCARVNGSAGELFSPFQEDAKSIALFVTDICRTINMPLMETEGGGPVHWKLGMKGLKFWADRRMLAAPDQGAPENWCFCPDGNRKKCSPSGTLSVSKCKFNAPAFMSYPHFYLADPQLLDAVEGLKPDPDRHRMTLTIEPVTGLPLEVNAALQINIQMNKCQFVGPFAKVRPTMMPMLWFRQVAEMSENIAKDVRLPVVMNMVLPPTGYALLGVSAVLLALGLSLLLLNQTTRSSTQAPRNSLSTTDLLNDSHEHVTHANINGEQLE